MIVARKFYLSFFNQNNFNTFPTRYFTQQCFAKQIVYRIIFQIKTNLKHENMAIINVLKEPFRKSQLKSKRKDLENKDFSIISSNCNGGCILHDLGMRFNSPFVNLWIKPQDFLKLLKDIPHYMSCDIVFTKEEGIDYPVGLLDDVRIYFQHYKTEQEAKSKWMDRVKRINYSNLFVMFSDRDGCTESDLQEFDRMPYKNKVAFVHKPYPAIKSAFYIKGFEEEESVGILSRYKGLLTLEKYYDDFDYVGWLNSNASV